MAKKLYVLIRVELIGDDYQENVDTDIKIIGKCSKEEGLDYIERMKLIDGHWTVRYYLEELKPIVVPEIPKRIFVKANIEPKSKSIKDIQYAPDNSDLKFNNYLKSEIIEKGFLIRKPNMYYIIIITYIDIDSEDANSVISEINDKLNLICTQYILNMQ